MPLPGLVISCFSVTCAIEPPVTSAQRNGISNREIVESNYRRAGQGSIST